MPIRAMLAAFAVLLLCASGRQVAEDHLNGLVSAWETEAPMMLRFRISADPVIAAVILWEADGTRLFPPPEGPPHVTEEPMLADIPRLDALRAAAAPTAWERVTRDGAYYYRCTALDCLKVDAPALLREIGSDAPTLDTLLAPPRSPVPAALLAAFAVAAIVIVVRRKRKPSALADPDGFRFGPARIEPNHMTARIGPHETGLTARDLRLIGLFRDNEGAVLSKDQLYATGWGRDYLPNSRALEQYILTLRRKLDPDRSGPGPIETVHGQGYRYRG